MTQKEMNIVLNEKNIKKRKKLIEKIFKNNIVSKTYYIAILTA